MEGYLKEALEIVKAQAGVRAMSDEEIVSMIKRLTQGIAVAVEENPEREGDENNVAVGIEPDKAIRERSVVCLECGKSFKVITKRHLASHGLTPDEYKEKHGYKKSVSLVAKTLARGRRKKMRDMKLWEKRKKANKKSGTEEQ